MILILLCSILLYKLHTKLKVLEEKPRKQESVYFTVTYIVVVVILVNVLGFFLFL